MCNRQDLIKQAFNDFYLDERASQRELEIAYETLTKGDKSNIELQGYRKAFELLMTDFYQAVDIKEDEQPCDVDNGDIDEECSVAMSSMPKAIRDAIDYANKEGANLSEACALTWATQNVNLPLFYHNVSEICHKFLWFKWWTFDDMRKIMFNSVMNPLEYITCTFELSSLYTYKTKDIQTFAKGVQQLYLEDKYLCQRFDIKNTGSGVVGFVVVEKDLGSHLARMLENKARQCNLNLSLVRPKEA